MFIFKGVEAEVLRKPGATPLSCPSPRWTPAVRKLMTEAITKLRDDGLVEAASQNCLWASRWHCVAKTVAGKVVKLRWVADLRAVNNKCVFPVTSMPRPDEFREIFAGKRFYCSLDMAEAFGR